jgi:hypothetical protein
VVLCLELVAAEILQRLRVGPSGKLAVADLLFSGKDWRLGLFHGGVRDAGFGSSAIKGGARKQGTDLDVAKHVRLDGGEGDGPENICSKTSLSVWAMPFGCQCGKQGTKHGGQTLGGLEELGCRDGIAVVGVDWHVNEGFLENVDIGASGRNLDRHVGVGSMNVSFWLS